MWLTVLFNTLQFALLGTMGIFVNTHPEPTARYRTKILVGCLMGSVIITVIASWQSWVQQRDSDAHEVILNGQSTDLKSQITDLKGQVGTLQNNLTDVKGKLSEISGQNSAMNAAIQKIMESGHIQGGPLADVVQRIIDKLPKETTIFGNNN